MFSARVRLRFSPDGFQRRHIHTPAGAPVSGRAVHLRGRAGCVQAAQPFCAVLLKALGSGPGTRPLSCPWLHPLGILWLRHDFHCQRLTDTSLFSLPAVTEATVLSGLSAVCRHTSAGEPRAGSLTSSRLVTCWWSVDLIRHLDPSEKEAFRSLFHASLLHRSQILP